MADVDAKLDDLNKILGYMSDLARGLALELHNASPDAANAYADKLEGVARNPQAVEIGKHASYVVSVLREGKKPND